MSVPVTFHMHFRFMLIPPFRQYWYRQFVDYSLCHFDFRWFEKEVNHWFRLSNHSHLQPLLSKLVSNHFSTFSFVHTAENHLRFNSSCHISELHFYLFWSCQVNFISTHSFLLAILTDSHCLSGEKFNTFSPIFASMLLLLCSIPFLCLKLAVWRHIESHAHSSMIALFFHSEDKEQLLDHFVAKTD